MSSIRESEKNPQYSLRAFARDLGVQAATLSHIMKRKRTPSASFKAKVYEALKLSVDQRDYLESQGEEIYKFNPIDMDIFLSLSEWYYDAIFELIRTKGFESQADFVAKRMGLSQEEA